MRRHLIHFTIMQDVQNEPILTGPEPGAVTRFLQQIRNGNKEAEAELFPLIYQELRRLASRKLKKERDVHTLQTTALVHEVYLKLVGGAQMNYSDRAHFFRVSANAMHQILVDLARNRLSQKRGAGATRVELTESLAMSEGSIHTTLLVHQLLEKLAARDAQQAKITELRFFGGLTAEEVAEALDVCTRTVHRQWDHGRAWMYEQLQAQARKS